MFVKELLKKYNGKTVVDGVSFELPKGKVISLIGPNGAGKSTVMGMISRRSHRMTVQWISRERTCPNGRAGIWPGGWLF